MIETIIKDGNFPNGVNEGLNTMLFKARDKENLSNQWPITLLNVSYKIFAKALQMRLQPIFMEVIDKEQFGFLPVKFILDNVLLVNETINQAWCNNQPLVVPKQNFAKVYDNVNWSFMFDAMATMGMVQEFIKMVKLLFKDAATIVYLNTCITKSRGLRRVALQFFTSFLLQGKS